MANHALYQQKKISEIKQKNILLHHFYKKLPHIIKETNVCLKNPWLLSGKCSFKTLTKSIGLLCLVDNSNDVTNSLQAFKKLLFLPYSSNYDVFCWISYGR